MILRSGKPPLPHRNTGSLRSTTSLRNTALLLGLVLAASAPAHAADKPAAAPKPHLHADSWTSTGSVTVGGKPIAYQAVVGTLVVHPKGWEDDDGPLDGTDQPAIEPGNADADRSADEKPKDKDAEATMSYVAYFATGPASGTRPITFVYNGGPGSSTVWLHMGAFGPRRVVTADDRHTAAAPYGLVNNDDSLLDATDLVFVDAPGTGFGRFNDKDASKAFWGIDEDGNAFADFVTTFLTRYGKWNAPKYLFGESYGTTRSAVLANILEQSRGIDLNGVILLSQILNFDLSIDGAEGNPGIDMPYVLALPTYAATAWYHHKLPGTPPPLDQLLPAVEQFATHDYLEALDAGSTLDPATRDKIADQLHAYTGLPLDYLKRANLRVEGGAFEHELQIDDDATTGRLDTRFSGPTIDPLAKEAAYDPQSAAISSAYVSTFNDYVRRTLHYDGRRIYKPYVDGTEGHWDNKHQPPGADHPLDGMTPNVMPDLASAMSLDPDLKVMLNAGYFDLATPFYEGIYEMHHLPMAARLQANIELKQYASGHMVYAHVPALGELHDNVAGFIRRTSTTERAPRGDVPATK